MPTRDFIVIDVEPMQPAGAPAGHGVRVTLLDDQGTRHRGEMTRGLITLRRGEPVPADRITWFDLLALAAFDYQFFVESHTLREFRSRRGAVNHGPECCEDVAFLNAMYQTRETHEIARQIMGTCIRAYQDPDSDMPFEVWRRPLPVRLPTPQTWNGISVSGRNGVANRARERQVAARDFPVRPFAQGAGPRTTGIQAQQHYQALVGFDVLGADAPTTRIFSTELDLAGVEIARGYAARHLAALYDAAPWIWRSIREHRTDMGWPDIPRQATFWTQRENVSSMWMAILLLTVEDAAARGQVAPPPRLQQINTVGSWISVALLRPGLIPVAIPELEELARDHHQAHSVQTPRRRPTGPDRPNLVNQIRCDIEVALESMPLDTAAVNAHEIARLANPNATLPAIGNPQPVVGGGNLQPVTLIMEDSAAPPVGGWGLERDSLFDVLLRIQQPDGPRTFGVREIQTVLQGYGPTGQTTPQP